MYEIAGNSPFSELRFDNSFTEYLPGDPDLGNQRRQVNNACYSLVNPTPVSGPTLAAFSREAAALLDFSESFCRSPEFTEIFSGNSVPPELKPFAMCYGGHQFGNWAGQLGDGRAINLGELVNSSGERWMLQLKGAGLTPYSRTADGLAVLRSSLREFICSEAMHHLGIPTTRALSLVLTGEDVVRDMFYNGNPKAEPGAIVCRLSPSFTRFGNFEILAARNDLALLRKLTAYTIKTDFPHLNPEPAPENYLQWFADVCVHTAKMIVHWMRVGFVHGVMNTDNMSILGLTIDYGPYGWLENYDPTWTPNTTDAHGRRYCYGNQPYMAQWNLTQLANALFPLIKERDPLQEALDEYRKTFQLEWQETLAAKIGLSTTEPDDDKLVTEHLELISLVETDMTIFYRCLADVRMQEDEKESPLKLFMEAYYKEEELTPEYESRFGNWLLAYKTRLKRNKLSDIERKQKMNRINPKYVFRNYLAQLAIDKAEQGDFSMIDDLLQTFRRPYDEQPEKEAFSGRRPEWARNKPGCSMLSCSS
ncbi:MAG: YdiU family protein [Desulfocapsaceae bacterium]|jgi:uncharacterized protein YdiU (UPF0061 family)|nr:YdiU family protein [Desulfocapsaceae bacterium]